MKIWINGQWRSGDNEPMAIVLEPKDIEYIKTGAPSTEDGSIIRYLGMPPAACDVVMEIVKNGIDDAKSF